MMVEERGRPVQATTPSTRVSNPVDSITRKDNLPALHVDTNFVKFQQRAASGGRSSSVTRHPPIQSNNKSGNYVDYPASSARSSSLPRAWNASPTSARSPRTPSAVAISRSRSPSHSPTRTLLSTINSEVTREVIAAVNDMKDKITSMYDEDNDWLTRFRRNSIVVPHVPATNSPYGASATGGAVGGGGGPASLVVASPAKDGPSRALNAAIAGGPNTRFPYCISLGSLEGLPLPKFVSQSYLDSDAPILLQIRLSLFDMESGSFFGRTWLNPSGINLRNPLANEDEDEDSGQSGSDAEESGSEGSRGDSKASDGRSSVDEKSRALPADVLSNQRITIDLGDMNLFLHTGLYSPHIVIVAEFVVIIEDSLSGENPEDPTLFQPEYISAGWTYFHMFDLRRGGLDLELAWEFNDPFPEELTEENQHRLNIYSGSPRVLIFLAPLLMDPTQEGNILRPISGANFKFHFSTAPSLRNLCYLWRENVWVGPEDDVPGLINEHNMIRPSPSGYVNISKIRVSVFPSVSKFEEQLLAEIALAHVKAFPDSLSVDEDGNLPLPDIIERRVHIGLHNTQTFLFPPVITSLQPVYSQEMGGDGFEYVFNGNIQLEKYFNDDPGLGIVFIVDYKIMIMTDVKSPPKTGLGAIIEKLSGSATDKKAGKVGAEKVISIGWGFWVPDGAGTGPNVLPLMSNTGPNPYSTVFYFPSCIASNVEDPWADFAEENGRFATNNVPVALSFLMEDERMITERMAAEMKQKATTPKVEKMERAREVSEPKGEMVMAPPSKSEQEDFDEEEDLHPSSQRPMSVAVNQQYPDGIRKLRGQMSRVEKARLLNSGFKLPIDDEGAKPAYVEYDMDVAVRDDYDEKMKQDIHEISLTFMAVNFNPNLKNRFSGHIPTSIYFTFQFYTFPYCATERVFVYTGSVPPSKQDYENAHQRSQSLPNAHNRMWSHQSHVSQRSFVSAAQNDQKDVKPTEDQWPGILYPVEPDGSISFDSPGITRIYSIDRSDDNIPLITYYKPGLAGLTNYMQHKCLQVDVWDGDSFLHVGSGEIVLRPGLTDCRHPGVYFDGEIDIMLTEEVDVENASARTETSNQAEQIIAGKLYFRIVNMGRKAVGDSTVSRIRKDPFARDAILLRDYRYAVQIRSEVTMFDLDMELHDLLSSAYAERLKAHDKENHTKDDHDAMEMAAARRRKVERIKRIQKKLMKDEEGGDNMPTTYALTRQERQRDLQTIDIFRERKKPLTIEDALAQQITTVHHIFASFGQAYFFEYMLTNPYNEECMFQIMWADDELRLITTVAEWRYLRRVYNIRVGVEEKLINLRPDGIHEVCLGPNETIAIPFVFQSFLGGQPIDAGEESFQRIDSMPQHEKGVHLGCAHNRVVHVSFLNPKRSPISLLDIVINSRGYYVDRVLRYFRPEGELFRRDLLYFPWTNRGTGKRVQAGSIFTPNDASDPYRMYVRCHNSDVRGGGKVQELQFKYRVGPAPETYILYFLFYTDPYHTCLSEIWRVFVHSLHRLDVNCVLGQTNHAALIIRGDPITRSVQCYSNLADELLIVAPMPTLLVANSLNEIGLILRPKISTTREAILNVVDPGQRCIVSTWLVVTHNQNPTITKSFEVAVQRNKGANKIRDFNN
ncbi:Nephrocystin-4 [Blyttiomyces sp. JEL0837]|nr:Nephrocystin-4 [Blyttiomyces sp. JEL0837]